MNANKNPNIVHQPRWPRNLAAVVLVLLAVECGWLALAAVPVLLCLLLYNLLRFQRKWGPTEDKLPDISSWRSTFNGLTYCLQPERFALCRCCGGWKDLRAIRRAQQQHAERAAAVQARVIAQRQQQAGGSL